MFDALLKLLSVDNATIALAASTSLPGLAGGFPPSAAETLVPAARRWLGRPDRVDATVLRGQLVGLALATEAEPARQLALDALASTRDPAIRGTLLHALALAPGDVEWCRRARAAVGALGVDAADNKSDTHHSVKWALGWLDARIRNAER